MSGVMSRSFCLWSRTLEASAARGSEGQQGQGHTGREGHSRREPAGALSRVPRHYSFISIVVMCFFPLAHG
jgi:hypothetical protein